MSDRTFLVVDSLFDGHAFRDETLVLELERGLVARVRPLGTDARLPAGALDLRGKTLLPGLIDAHCHVARTGLFEAEEPPNPGAVAFNLRAAVEAGVTTAGDMGCTLPLIDALRRHTADTPGAGPSIRAAGPLLTAPLGYPLDWMSPVIARLGTVIPCPDQKSARRSVERLARGGVDHVKIAIMHRGYGLEPLPAVSSSVARAVVEEAHALGLRVLAHAHWYADYRVAMAAGVDALMHSSFDPLDDEMVARVRDAGIPVCPTLWVFHSACLGAEQRWDRDPERTKSVVSAVQGSWRRFAEAYAVSGDVLPSGIAGGLPKEAALRGVRNAVANLMLLRDAGVPLAFGTDGPYGFSTIARPHDELVTLHAAGLSVEEVLRAATSGAARLLGLDDRGEITEGRRADLVALDGDPRRDLASLGRVGAVWVRGERVDGSAPAPTATVRAVLGGLGRTLGRAFVTQLSQFAKSQ